jgi:hypothetical protein
VFADIGYRLRWLLLRLLDDFLAVEGVVVVG